MLVPPSELSAWKDTALKSLYWDGIVKLPWVWPESEVQEYVSYMKSRPMFNAHVKAKSDGVPRKWGECEVLSYDMADTVAAPHFFEFAIQFTDIVEAYLGSPPHMYSLNAFATFPGVKAPNPDIQLWHRDRDDTKFIALFLYGSDVNSDSFGPHMFAKGSHRNNDGGHHPPTEPVDIIYGRAGTAFLEDPSGLHLGVKPREGERLLAWARWCVSEMPQSYQWDALKPVSWTTFVLPCLDGQFRRDPIPITPATRESTKLVVDWNA